MSLHGPPNPPSHTPGSSDSYRSTNTAGGSDPKNPVGLQTPSARTREATAEIVATPSPTTATGLRPAFHRANSTAPPQRIRRRFVLYPVPHCQHQHRRKHRITLSTQPSLRRHLLHPADPDSHQCQHQLPVPLFRLQHVGDGSPRNEHFGNDGGIPVRISPISYCRRSDLNSPPRAPRTSFSPQRS